ncbi:CBS domain-containing protein [Gemmobacter megaterium]|uniref:CBS domain-containing protein n=1 Tax=Gemmobacter megaterium TaxID=1086013 RepID=A0A1N7KRV2_9RHOB|nr:CBS domain-containing protein [Gemmobacter megaterium]GGE03509.1 inosine-5-monophosphate dehydrogenase [Gemmobacter megaterium]SIS64319.1 CBS domain-containing protein [Gemmobacter megaterium]
MLVQQILNAKPDQSVVTVPPGSTVREAVELLAARRIGAVVVSSDGARIAGILSERDVVRELGRQGPEVLDRPVDSLMTAAITTCTRGATALQVIELMTQGRFRHLPVVEDGRMIGMISIGDVVKARLDELAMEKDALEGMIKGH